MTASVAPAPATATPAREPGKRLAAALVHVYTASGSVLGLLLVLAAVRGEVSLALWLSLAAMLIDGTDGMLARRLRVKERIPVIDGARMDDIVDYLTYVFAPMVLLVVTDRLPGGGWGTALAALPLLASCYQFCRVDAKTEDHFFLGFPSYWNVIAFYAFVLDWSPGVLSAVLVVCSILVFVPVRYLYPSRTEALWPVNIVLTACWLVLYGLLVAELPAPSLLWTSLSVAYLLYYVGVSLFLTARAAGRTRANRASGPAA